jgi:hypothetical protein
MVTWFSTLLDLFANRNLARHGKSFYQISFTALHHARTFFEPFPARNFRLGIQPSNHQQKLVSRNVSLLDTFKQMRIQRSRQILAENFWHGSLAIKSTRHGRFQPHDFRGIIRVGQSISQFTQFPGGELAAVSQLESKLNHFRLFRRRQLLDFLDDRACGHGVILNHVVMSGKKSLKSVGELPNTLSRVTDSSNDRTDCPQAGKS